MPGRQGGFGGQDEPVKAIRRQGEQIGELANRREGGAAEQIDRHAAGEIREIELHRLRRARDDYRRREWFRPRRPA